MKDFACACFSPASSAALAAVPAAAATTYDAFASFTGTNTGGAFTYGSFDEAGSFVHALQ